MEADGIVKRTLYPQVPPKVDINTTMGAEIVPTLDALLKWAALREEAGKQKEEAEDQGDSD